MAAGRGCSTAPAPHTVNAKAGGFLRTPYGPRRKVNVSGMAAKKTWDKGAGKAVDAARRDAAAAFVEGGRLMAREELIDPRQSRG